MTMTITFGIISSIVALGGIFVAYLFYIRGAFSATSLREQYEGIYEFLYNKWYMDDLYNRAIVQPLRNFSMFLWRVVDEGIIDATVNGVATGIAAISQRIRGVQTGLVANYALAIALGMVVLVGAYLAIFSDLFQ
jgi:NADH-quinone oxidoreductase subunit L